MSRKNNVNPDYYKQAGRDKPDDDRRPQPRPGGATAPPPRRGRKRPPPRNFIPGAPPVGERAREAPETSEEEAMAHERSLQGKTVAILVEHGFEQSEMTEPRKALEQAGAHTELISPVSGKVKGWKHAQWGDEFRVDVTLDAASPESYDALLLPGGVMNPDRLRMNPAAVAFVKAFVDAGKPIAAICHGPWTLIEADAVRGRRVTSWPSLRTDLRNAGAEWTDQEALVDDGIVTSRKPDDIPAFNHAMIQEFAKGAHEKRRAA